MGIGLGGYVRAMCVDTINNFLYVGGWFNQAGSIPVEAIAMWDGYEWHAVGSGVNNEIDALCFYRGDLYMGGNFTFADNDSCSRIAKWDGMNWSYLGENDTTEGTNYPVNALEVFNDELYLAGYFDTAGGEKAYGIARWYVPPDSSCNFLQPRVFSNAENDTAFWSGGEAYVQFENNNAWANTWQWDFGDGQTDSVQKPLHVFSDSGSFSVCVTVTHDYCFKTVCKGITVVNGTGKKEYEQLSHNFNIFPNPAGKEVNIECNITNRLEAYVEVIDLAGQSIKKLKLKEGYNKIAIDTSGWNAGTYICRLHQNQKNVISKKLVVQ